MFYLRKQHIYQQEADENGDGGGGEADTQDASQNTEVEDKARKMGWTPKDEFKGDPDKWRDAAEFVERGENMLPLLRAETKKQERKIAELERSIKEFAEYHTKTEQRAYQKAFQDLKARQIEAVSAGDANAFVQIDQEIADLQKEAAQTTNATNKPPPEYFDWEDRNPWVKTDQTMLAYAESQGDYIRRTKPSMSYADMLEAVTKAVKKEFPEKFENPRRNAAPSVEGATPPPKKGGKTYADLPKEAKDACDRFVSKFGVKREEYVKNYFEE